MNYYELKNDFTIDNFIKKVYNDSEYISRMAQYNLTETTKLTGSFIRQGHNFVDKRVLKFSKIPLTKSSKMIESKY